jgi:CxxC motif-containing protein
MIEEKKLICVTCPRGCQLTAEVEDGCVLDVSGCSCKRGKTYAEAELTDPRRMIASTVRISGGIHPMLPVTTSAPIPKGLILQLMAVLRTVDLQAPVRMNDVIVSNVLGTGIDVIASADMEKV